MKVLTLRRTKGNTGSWRASSAASAIRSCTYQQDTSKFQINLSCMSKEKESKVIFNHTPRVQHLQYYAYEDNTS
jgi:hypothetical protein